MKINIKGQELELQYRMRALLKYEEKTGKSISFEGMNSFTGILELLYCVITGTMEHRTYRDLGLTLTWEEFLDWLDDQEPNKLVDDFNKWLVEIVQSQTVVNNENGANEERDPN